MKIIYYLCLLGVPFGSFSQVQIGTELQTSIRNKTILDSYIDRVDIGLNCAVFFGKHKISAGPLLSSESFFQGNEEHQFKITGFNTAYAYELLDEQVFDFLLTFDVFYNHNMDGYSEVITAKYPGSSEEAVLLQIHNGHQHQVNYLMGFNIEFDLGKHFYSGMKLQAGNNIGWSRIHDPDNLVDQKRMKRSDLSSALQFQIGYKF